MFDEQSLVSTDYPRHDGRTRSQARDQVLEAAIVQADTSESFEVYGGALA
jgi:hypothetical protein